jgi:hypothetical protein
MQLHLLLAMLTRLMMMYLHKTKALLRVQVHVAVSSKLSVGAATTCSTASYLSLRLPMLLLISLRSV